MDTKFKLFHTKWSIKSVKNIPFEDSSLFGNTNSSTKLIQIADEDVNGVKFTKEDKELTLYHELVHAMLITGQYFTENDNEPLVEWIANCIMDLKNQKII